jgi:lycopene cyclase domain-containing protein
LQNHYTYFLLLAASLAGPLALSFDKKVAFYKKWKYFFPASIGPALFYIIWDIYFTSLGVWGFNEKYISGIKLFNLPLEEILFFLIVPYCCVFIYECIRCYWPDINGKRNGDGILKMIALVLLVTGIIFNRQMYTWWTLTGNAVCIAIVYLFKRYFRSFDAASFLISYIVVLIPFLIVNGFLTAIPVVIYNDAENLGTRIYTIPVEDVFYGMLLFLMNIVIYEKMKTRMK